MFHKHKRKHKCRHVKSRALIIHTRSIQGHINVFRMEMSGHKLHQKQHFNFKRKLHDRVK